MPTPFAIAGAGEEGWMVRRAGSKKLWRSDRLEDGGLCLLCCKSRDSASSTFPSLPCSEHGKETTAAICNHLRPAPSLLTPPPPNTHKQRLQRRKKTQKKKRTNKTGKETFGPYKLLPEKCTHQLPEAHTIRQSPSPIPGSKASMQSTNRKQRLAAVNVQLPNPCKGIYNSE